MTEDQDAQAPAAEPAANVPKSDVPAADLDLDALIAEYTSQAGGPERAQPVVQPQPTPERDYGGVDAGGVHRVLDRACRA